MSLYVNNIAVDTSHLAPETTLLRYLREQQALTGTKEGCASGDCGACTVMVANVVDSQVKVKAINSCICPVASLENHHVITVEGLTPPGADELHPVQQSMVECHGSQCGFCTPGFVMSLATLKENRPDLATAQTEQQREAVLDAISGNLCRCTGYRPIVDAGCNTLSNPSQAINMAHKKEAAAPASHISGSINPNQFYALPQSEDELQELLARHPDSRIIAGGTDLMLEVTQQYKAAPKLIDVSQLKSLTQIEYSTDSIQIGAAVTLAQLEETLCDLSPSFVTLLQRIGSRQIRNRGTIGGNICNASPIADTPPFLLVLDAVLHLVNAQGHKRELALTEFYLGYKQTALKEGEYLAAIEISLEKLKQPTTLLKLSKRYEDDISAILGAFTLTPQGTIQIAFGGMAATPTRATQTERQLKGVLDDQNSSTALEKACETLKTEFTPMTDVRASSAYRMEMAANLLKKAYTELTTNSPAEGVFSHA